MSHITILIILYIASILINRWLMVKMMKIDGEEHYEDYVGVFIFWFLPVITTIIFSFILVMKYANSKDVYITKLIKSWIIRFFLIDKTND